MQNYSFSEGEKRLFLTVRMWWYYPFKNIYLFWYNLFICIIFWLWEELNDKSINLQFSNYATCSQTSAAAVVLVWGVLGTGSLQGSLIHCVVDDKLRKCVWGGNCSVIDSCELMHAHKNSVRMYSRPQYLESLSLWTKINTLRLYAWQIRFRRP